MRPQDLVEQALGHCTADGAIVIVQDHTETNLRWAANSLTTNGQMHSRSVTVISTYAGERGTSAGVLTRAIADEAELAQLVADSQAAGRVAAPAEDASPLVENYAHADDWQAPPTKTAVEVFAGFAPKLGAAFAEWRQHGRELYGFAEHQLTSTFLGTSTGLRRRFDQPEGRVEINGKSDHGSRSAYVNQHTTDFADVDATALTDQLGARLEWAANRLDLPAGRYETLLPPSAVADLLIYAYWSAAARDAEEGRSAFATHGIGQRLSTLPLRLYSDPTFPGLECAPFEIATASSSGTSSVFDNGLPTPATDWIAGGTLTDLVRSRAWAARTGAKPRPAISNLIMDAGGSKSIDELVAGTERGLLLTCLWYIREVDPQTLLLTGLTRDGVYLIDQGRIAGAVNNFRFNESPLDLLGRAVEAGRTERTLGREWSDYFTRTAMPALRVPDFNMSTISAAN